MSIQIITNNKPYPILTGKDLTPKEKAEFDYINFDDDSGTEYEERFIRYCKQIYDLHEFTRIELVRTNMFTTVVEKDNPLAQWQGIQTDSFFSGIVIKYVNDNEQVIIGRYFS